MSEVKLCKDCKHCMPFVINTFFVKAVHYEYSKCSHVSATDLVTGEGTSCSVWRSNHEKRCGEEGKFWEAK